ncbi:MULTISPECIES: hypothetical protein [Xenorhabdus]|uniref:hypothetical protein n=1 Tax=Xenorhabdus TaxID=626 RepID=UPI000AC7C38F|nr:MULTISPECIES: hypothetical protein [Xenorhabdus]
MKRNISIDENTISMFFEKEFMQVPDRDNSLSESKYIRAIALIRDKEGITLPNISVAILETKYTNFDDVNLYAADKKTPLKIQNIDTKSRGFFIDSDDNGKLIFYIYPKKLTSLVFQVESCVSGLTGHVISKNKIFIIDNNKVDHELPPIDIEGNGEYFQGDPETSYFNMLIPSYFDAKVHDTILFFVDNTYTYQSISVDNLDDLGNSYKSLPYNIFPVNKKVSFFYTIVDHLGNSRSSDELTIYYRGGGKNKPLDDLERTYSACKVYNSYGVSSANLLVNSINSRIHEVDVKNRCNNEHHEGLFVQIEGTNDPTDKTKVPVGAEVTLYLYINSVRYQISQNYQSAKKIMELQKGIYGDNKITFGIPFKYVGHIFSGQIYLDYKVNYYGDIYYGKIWESQINTILPGGDAHPDNDNCPDEKTWSGIW